MCKNPQSQCTGCPKSSCVIVAIWNGKLSIRLFLPGITCGVQSDKEIMTGGMARLNNISGRGCRIWIKSPEDRVKIGG